MTRKRNHKTMVGNSVTDHFVVAIDFGTTYSGVAFAWVHDDDTDVDIEVIKQWPGGNNATSQKVPTQIAYVSTGNLENILWGAQLKTTDDSLRHFKLLLQDGQEFPAGADAMDLKVQIKTLRKKPEEVVKDFLQQLLASAKEHLSRLYGTAMLSSTSIEYVLTVPACWDDAAKDATIQAAMGAGLSSSVHLIGEPEAAAKWVLHKRPDFRTATGDTFVVCDAGGGTVDLITYKIESSEPLHFHEVVPGQGQPCGSAMLNFLFKKMVQGRVTAEEWSNIRHFKSHIWARAIDYFENEVKRKFNPLGNIRSNDAEYLVPLPSVADNVACNIEDNFMTLHSHEVKQMFDNVVSKIIELVYQQIESACSVGSMPKAVILVGGFGDSPYLFESIQKAMMRKHASVTVLQSPDAWTAVVRGAVLSGLPASVQVTSRKSAYYYGVSYSDYYDPAKHQGLSSYWDEFLESSMVGDQMLWHIKRGDTIKDADPILLEFSLSVRDIPRSYTNTLYYCNAGVAPSGYNAATVYALCVCNIDMDNIPTSAWEIRMNSKGVKFKHLRYQLGVTKKSALLEFDVRVKGQIYGTAQATFSKHAERE